jgi:hypothetical protein
MNAWTKQMAQIFNDDRNVPEENHEQLLGKHKSIDRITKRLARRLFSNNIGDMNRIKFLQLCGTYDENQQPITRNTTLVGVAVIRTKKRKAADR